MGKYATDQQIESCASFMRDMRSLFEAREEMGSPDAVIAALRANTHAGYIFFPASDSLLSIQFWCMAGRLEVEVRSSKAYYPVGKQHMHALAAQHGVNIDISELFVDESEGDETRRSLPWTISSYVSDFFRGAGTISPSELIEQHCYPVHNAAVDAATLTARTRERLRDRREGVQSNLYKPPSFP